MVVKTPILTCLGRYLKKGLKSLRDALVNYQELDKAYQNLESER